MRLTTLVYTLAASFVLAAPSVHAVYDHYVTWADMSSIDLRPVLETEYASEKNLFEPAFPESAQELALRDADSLVSPQFHVSDEMLEQVRFWLRIYTEFSTRQTVLFDSRHPEIVYEVMDFRDLAKTARNRVVYEILRERQIKRTSATYKRAFAELIKNPKRKKLSREEQNILAAVKRSTHRHSLREFSTNLRFQTGQRDNVIKGLLAAEAFFPQMEAIFRKHGVPTEITRVALVESSFNLKAVSRVGASGVWQFMRPSAREYMRVDESLDIDERASPLKATVGAAKLFTRGYKLFGNWPLAIVSYNQGLSLPRNYRKPEQLPKLYEMFSGCKKSRLGWAGRSYYAEFIALLHAESYREVFYGRPPSPTVPPVVFQRLKDGKHSAMQIAMSHGISIQEFKFINPDIRNLQVALPKGLLIALPGQGDIMQNLATLTESLRGMRRTKKRT